MKIETKGSKTSKLDSSQEKHPLGRTCFQQLVEREAGQLGLVPTRPLSQL